MLFGHMAKIQRALISVFYKDGLVPFAKKLAEAGIEIISTGGTAKTLKEHDITVKDLSDYTGFPEMLDGRVKTLHPKVHGGLLYIRSKPEHESAVQKHGIAPIDLVVVNLYPFEETIAKPDVSLEEAIEKIDIGGPSMLRSAAKNHQDVTVVVSPDDYERVAEQIAANGATTLELRRELAVKVFAKTSQYDKAIATHFGKVFGVETGAKHSISRELAQSIDKITAEYLDEQLSATEDSETDSDLHVQAKQAQTLRYGENPHQKATLYGNFGDFFTQLHGKELSYNNILDLTAAANLIGEFSSITPTLAILKHTNPCGVGQASSLKTAWDLAFSTDRQAPFGGIIAVNQTLDLPCAEAIAEIFSEVIIAPDFSAEALSVLKRKKNLRLIKILKANQESDVWDIRSVGAESYLHQERDTKSIAAEDLKIVTERHPNEAELQAMLFGWKIVKHVKSNAIVYTNAKQTLGVGAGQMSRVDASQIAVWKAREAKLSLKDSVICSDAFFPFPDGLIAAAEAGATAAIQPGGSKRDKEVIQAANERNMAMVFTGIRHFRH
jgi:phosphoribosylaminoimidazolecarboxamide formyltransferase / IMP cyclohydrolase